jgi:sporulation protein YlmC with PRC-barrel domain
MRSKLLIGGLLATVLFVPALAQTNPPTSNPPAPAATPAPATRADAAPASTTLSHADMWRASKLIGVNVYNDQNEKLGDINEIILDKSGKVAGLVVGVGGFLGMGRHDVMVEMSKLKFVDEPVRTSSTTTGASRPAGTTGATSTAPSSSSSSSSKKWYPDHAVWSGVTKDQLKGMTEFKYD